MLRVRSVSADSVATISIANAVTARLSLQANCAAGSLSRVKEINMHSLISGIREFRENVFPSRQAQFEELASGAAAIDVVHHLFRFARLCRTC